MEIGQLQAFEHVAREGSFTSAAESLGLTQPSVSARVAALERELGGQLFERGRRRLRLTPLGRTFMPYVERALAALTDGQEAVQRLKEGKLGQVSVAALNPLAMYILPTPMQRFREEYPSVDLTIRIRITREIIDMLYEGQVSLGLISAPLWDKGLQILARFQEPVSAVVNAHHPLAQCDSLCLADIYDHTIYRVTLNPRGNALVDSLAEHARQGSGGAVIAVPTTLAVDLLLHGDGVAFLPRSYVQSFVDERRLAFLTISDLPQLYNEPILIALRGRELDAPNMAFVALLRQEWQHILIDS